MVRYTDFDQYCYVCKQQCKQWEWQNAGDIIGDEWNKAICMGEPKPKTDVTIYVCYPCFERRLLEKGIIW